MIRCVPLCSRHPKTHNKLTTIASPSGAGGLV
jgi:hypothetical protein